MIIFLFMAALFLCGFAGLPGLFMIRDDERGQRLASALNVVGSLLGLLGCAGVFFIGHSVRAVLPWRMPLSEPVLSVDGMSAFFLAPLFIISALGSIYGEEYWPQKKNPGNGRGLRLWYGVLTASVAMVFLAGDWILFLFGWEIMALAGFFLVRTEDHDPAARKAGWIYLISTHTGTLAVFGLVTLLHRHTGNFGMVAAASGLAGGRAGIAIFFLALIGFGFKAGMMPFHIWLPGAHAAAPSHVSAIMSGVLLKTGIYGFFRLFSLFPDPPLWWGGALLFLGLVSGILGVAYALGQHDLKRLLAYHSIENIGIIVMGLGLGLVGRTLGRPGWVALGFGGALLHVVNHALFKSLLFHAAGAVIHAVGTREMDRMGGLAKLMPRASLGFLVGAAAICGLPPLNGFVSEWLIFIGLFDSALSPWFWGALAAPGLALIGALALACFVKAYGAVFLGEPRTEGARHAHDAGPFMLTSLGSLAALCALIGLAPCLVAPLLDAGIKAAGGAPMPRLETLVSFPTLSLFALTLLALVAGFALLLSRTKRSAALTWDCGYAAPSPRMQYTSSSFADWCVNFFRWALLPEKRSPRLTEFFERRAEFESHVPDAVLDRAMAPVFRGVERAAGAGARLQPGYIQVYLLYVGLTLLFLMALV